MKAILKSTMLILVKTIIPKKMKIPIAKMKMRMKMKTLTKIGLLKTRMMRIMKNMTILMMI